MSATLSIASSAPSWTHTLPRTRCCSVWGRASRPRKHGRLGNRSRSPRELLSPLPFLIAPAARFLLWAHRKVLELEDLPDLAASFPARADRRVHLDEALGPLDRFFLRVHRQDRIAGD